MYRKALGFDVFFSQRKVFVYVVSTHIVFFFSFFSSSSYLSPVRRHFFTHWTKDYIAQKEYCVQYRLHSMMQKTHQSILYTVHFLTTSFFLVLSRVCIFYTRKWPRAMCARFLNGHCKSFTFSYVCCPVRLPAFRKLYPVTPKASQETITRG